MKEKLKNYRLFWGIVFLLIALDQLAKYLVQLFQPVYADHVLASLWPGFSLVYVKNTGAAWGVMAGSGYILGSLAVVALFAIYFLRRALQLKRLPIQIAFGLLVAGIAGNMIDRLILGYVVDFFDCTFWGFRFPAFNIADAGITVGVALYIIYSSLDGSQSQVKAKAKA